MPNEVLRKNILFCLEALTAIFAKAFRFFHPGFDFFAAIGARN
jgi:hypothetical protein